MSASRVPVIAPWTKCYDGPGFSEPQRQLSRRKKEGRITKGKHWHQVMAGCLFCCISHGLCVGQIMVSWRGEVGICVQRVTFFFFWRVEDLGYQMSERYEQWVSRAFRKVLYCSERSHVLCISQEVLWVGMSTSSTSKSLDEIPCTFQTVPRWEILHMAAKIQ